ncbi:MAG TPA: hypothetical protein VFU48_13970, partial [Nitrospira sp.]|nr:hypothetical protein [Nitrospira sp.]
RARRRRGIGPMAANNGPKEPSRPTVKRLFAVSGNLCAFPKCATPLVDPQSGSIVGEVCHIKGEKPGAARYDSAQTNEQRHGFDNLILLCNVHHKIVDDDNTAYTVERLLQMKQQHESRHAGPPPVDAATADRFITVAINNSTVHGSVVTSRGQTGGQTAQTIHNYYGSSATEEGVQLEGKLDTAGDLGIINAIGCPGMQLTVICRGSRPAKIKSAYLLIDEVDVMGGFQQGFGADFGYTPLEGSTQMMVVTLIPLSRPNSQEGFVLSRDDVARFFYPLPIPATTLALRAKSENLSIVVNFFDDTEQMLLMGQPIKDVLEGVFHVYQQRHGHLNVPIKIAVRVKSTTRPGPEMADLIGKVNPNRVPMATPADEPSPDKPAEEKA